MEWRVIEKAGPLYKQYKGHYAIANARKTALQDGYDQIVYQDEPGSVAYCRSCLYGNWPNQTEENIIITLQLWTSM